MKRIPVNHDGVPKINKIVKGKIKRVKYHADGTPESKYTAAVAAKIVEIGNTLEVAADLVGVARNSIDRWAVLHPAFGVALARAKSTAEAWHVENIRAQAASDWRASESWLERRSRKHWGKRETILIGDMSKYTDEDLEKIASGEPPPEE